MVNILTLGWCKDAFGATLGTVPVARDHVVLFPFFFFSHLSLSLIASYTVLQASNCNTKHTDLLGIPITSLPTLSFILSFLSFFFSFRCSLGQQIMLLPHGTSTPSLISF